MERTLSPEEFTAAMSHTYVAAIDYGLCPIGKLSGTPMVIVRLAAYASPDAQILTPKQIVDACFTLAPDALWVRFTGDDPVHHLDAPLIDALHDAGWRVAVETAGLLPLKEDVDWITLLVRQEEILLRQLHADEVIVVRSRGQGLPTLKLQASHYLLTPTCDNEQVSRSDLMWVRHLVFSSPGWSLTLPLLHSIACLEDRR